MAHDLRSGSRLIRLLQITALVIAGGGGVLACLLLASPEPAAATRYTPFILAAFILDALLIIVVIGMLAARGLVKRINVLAGAFDRGAEGDLTVRVDLGAEDELSTLGQNFNGMLEKLAGIVTSINASIVELRRIAARNDEASGQVMATAKIQVDGVTETATAIEAITRSAEKVAEGVETLARSAADNAVSIREMSASIVEVRRNVEAQAEAIDNVSSSISETVAVVEETNRNVAGLKKSAGATSASVAEMDLSIQQVEKSIQAAAAIAQGVHEEARQGKEAAEATIAGIGGIRQSSGNTFSSITRLSERVAAIGNIISVIDELTEQTNLLALNSAIIAAQAGEHGKGFAIVAGEIKELANRTKRSTTEIAELIQGIREETGTAVAAIEATEERVAAGEQLSRRSGEALNRIVASVQVVTDQVNAIARATEEQARGSREIHTAMHDVADMATQIATSSQEQTATSRAIVGSVQWMKELTAKVLASTSRQERVGDGIAESTAQMSEVVEVIRGASIDETACCRRITDSAVRVQGSAQGTMESARTMEAAVESLSTQIEVIRQEIAKLHVA
jgi:methyl-accepting chemotaxis protein